MNEFKQYMEELRSSKQTKVTVVDQKRAARLRAYVGQNNWFVSRNKKRWAHAFAVLRRRLKRDQELIDKVLDFIIAHKVVKPKIGDGAKLLKEDVWDWLVDMLEDESNVEVTDEARDIVKRVVDLGWPAKAKDELPRAVQMSLNVVRPFFQEVKRRLDEYSVPIVVQYDPKIHLKSSKNRRIVKFHPRRAKYRVFWDSLPLNAHEFVKAYFRWLNAKANQWPDFSWTLKAMAFRLEDGIGQQFVMPLTHWDEIVKEVKNG